MLGLPNFHRYCLAFPFLYKYTGENQNPTTNFLLSCQKKIKTYSNGKCIKIGEIRSSQCGIKWDIYSKVIKYQGIIDINLLYKKYYLGFPPIMFVTVDGSSCYT